MKQFLDPNFMPRKPERITKKDEFELIYSERLNINQR
jgi:hypothetical protein